MAGTFFNEIGQIRMLDPPVLADFDGFQNAAFDVIV